MLVLTCVSLVYLQGEFKSLLWFDIESVLVESEVLIEFSHFLLVELHLRDYAVIMATDARKKQICVSNEQNNYSCTLCAPTRAIFILILFAVLS